MKNRILLIDGNNRAHAALHAYKRLSYKGENVAILYGLPSMIKYLIKEYQPDQLMVVWDGKRSLHRKAIYPEYKGKRKEDPLFDRENFDLQMKVVKKMLYYLGVKQVLNPNAEADDMIYKLHKVAEDKGYKECIVVSGDKDFHQLIGRKGAKMKVKVFSESKKLLIDVHNCQDTFGYKGWQTVDHLTLLGDKSDNINGYRGMGEVKTKQFLDQFGSLESFIIQKHKHSVVQVDTLLELMKRNEILIDLGKYHDKYKEELKTVFYLDPKPKIQRNNFLKISAKYGMNKFMSRQFMSEFKTLQK